MRDPESGSSKRYGIVSFDNFDSSDEALKKMNGQYISGKPVDVTYAYKKDTKGERHGSVAERILAVNRPANLYSPIFGDNSSLNSINTGMNNNFAMNPVSQDINNHSVNKFPNPPVGTIPNYPNFSNIKTMPQPQFPPMNNPIFNNGHNNIRPPSMMPPPN